MRASDLSGKKLGDELEVQRTHPLVLVVVLHREQQGDAGAGDETHGERAERERADARQAVRACKRECSEHDSDRHPEHATEQGCDVDLVDFLHANLHLGATTHCDGSERRADR
jgi:hypothetical protein